MVSAPEPISGAHDASLFSCGKPTLDNWLRQRALSNHRNGFTSVIVVHEAHRIIGYYGLAPTAIAPSALSRSVRTGQPPDPLPCLLLGQLAVDEGWRGRGIGSGLRKHAYLRCAQAAKLIGGRALLVKAIDAQAREHWLRQRFVPTKDDPMTLYRPMSEIFASIKEAGLRR